MPDIEFTERTPLGRHVRLSSVQWTHILERHPEMAGQQEKFTETLREPEAVLYDRDEENYQYLKRFRQSPVTDKFLLLVVRHLNGDGFVITAFFVSRVRRSGKELVYGDERVFDQLR
ncbi:MAG: PBECR2 nuclease fold domain-containing protein [Deltaproteobacteria bacterium]|nr:PBECR2 nuclease fold domain-containing protein [Deltaproteobacteria bacterium]